MGQLAEAAAATTLTRMCTAEAEEGVAEVEEARMQHH